MFDREELLQAIYTPSRWDPLFNQAQVDGTVPLLLQALEGLPASAEQKSRIHHCQWVLRSRKTRENTRDIRDGLLSLFPNLLAMGLWIAFNIEVTPTEEQGPLLEQAEEMRKSFPPVGMYSSDQEGAGRFALSMASAHISRCDEARALEELCRAERYYMGLDHPDNLIRLDFQKLRLSFMVGEYLRVGHRSMALHQRAKGKLDALCECIVHYRYWSGLFTGQQQGEFHPPELYNLFYQHQKTTLSYPEDEHLEGILQVYLYTVDLVNELHRTFPVFYRKSYQDHMTFLKKRIQEAAVKVEPDEVGDFITQLCPAFAQALCGEEEGLLRLQSIHLPTIAHSVVFQSMRSACLLEACMVQPYAGLPEDVHMHLECVRQVPSLKAERDFLLAWMKNLCPHVLHLVLQGDAELSARWFGGIVFVGGDKDSTVVYGQEDKKLNGYPHKVVSETLLSSLGGIQLTHGQYVSALGHERFFEAYGLHRAVFSSLIEGFFDRPTLKPIVPGGQ